MLTQFKKSEFFKIENETVVKFCKPNSIKSDPIVKKLDSMTGGAVGRLYDSEEFGGKIKQTAVFYNVTGMNVSKIILAGIGEKKLEGRDHYRQSGGVLSRQSTIKNSKSLGIWLDNDNPQMAQAVIEGLILGGFQILDYKTGDDDKPSKLESVTCYARSATRRIALNKALDRGAIISDSVNLARRLTSHPGNYLTPRKFAAEVKSLATKYKFECEILDEKKIASEKMGAFLSVAKGSAEPPRFVIMRYKGGRAGRKPVVLVGKGITFDSGGISLKPGLNMGEMKGDMQGAAVVTGVMTAAARLRLPINLIALTPLAENLPSSKASKPGDIITSRKGKTVEIINTDAEGRLILADALDYANKFKPQAVIDVATLTGAATYVLGPAGIPLIGNNSNVINTLLKAAKTSAEKAWELPLWDDYTDFMKSNIADLKNSGGKWAGTLTAAAFLKEFIGDWPWVHIDIAAVDLELKGRPYIPVGATGRGTRLLIEFLSTKK
jgi:leucyl aminopeptidase